MGHGSKVHLNQELIAKLRSFQIPGEADMIAEIADILRGTTPEKITAIRQWIVSGDMEAAGKEAHSLKSSALSLGAERMGGICQAIEAISGLGLAAVDVKTQAEALCRELNEEWIIVQDELNKLK